jgi:DNA topoisomerase-3
MQLIVTEKPSVARDLARVLGARSREEGCIRGDGIVLSWCRGHMAELVEPAHYRADWKRWSFDTLPMLPEDFQLRARAEAKDQWAILRKLLRDRALREVVNACDAGREGELIFRYAYELAGCTAPVRRLWVASMTDAALSRAWQDLRDGARYDGLADAARCRSEADWLVGLNATRAMTCLAQKGGGSQLLSVGRVQTPTLAMIVERDGEIAAFEPEDFWRVEATVQAPAAAEPDGTPPSWPAVFTRLGPGSPRPRDKDARQQAERFSAEAPAEQLVAAVTGRDGRVVQAERREKREPPPLLYDLTSLQRRANQRFGFSAARTLELAQALYERHKLLTYPRTDSRHLTPDQAATLPEVVRSLAAVPPYAPHCAAILEGPFPRPGKRVVDASEVGDHHAILPTGRDPLTAQLAPDEKRIFDLVARRVLAALLPPARFALTTLVVAIDTDAPVPEDAPPPLHFQAKGRVCLEPGWQAADPPARSRRQADQQALLPLVDEGAPVHVPAARSIAGQTRPPRPHNDASILQAMETAGRQLDDAELKRALRGAGLGTPATRAAILQTLIRRGFVERRGRDLRATDRGIALIAAVPVDELKSAALTGRWEARLSAMAEGQESRTAFMADVRAHVGRIVGEISTAEPPPPEAREESQSKSLGDCPTCGAPVRLRRSVYTCDTGRACTFVIWGTVAQRKISAAMVKKLLKSGRAGPYKGFKSKKGKPFSAILALDKEGRVGLDFGEDDTSAEPVGACPVCEKPVRRRGSRWTCDTGRDCSFVIWETIAKRPMDDDTVRTLLAEKRVGPLEGFQSKKGKPFSASLVLSEEGRAVLDFDDSGPSEAEPLGACPACEKPVRRRGSRWTCDTGRDCSFVIWETIAKRPMDDDTVRTLLAEKRVGPLEGFQSKKGKPFSASLVLSEEGRAVLDFDDSGPSEAEPLGACPACEKPVRRRGSRWTCDTGRDCSFIIWETIAKRPMDDDTVRTLLAEKRVGPLEGFQSKKGSLFSATLSLSAEGRVELEFSARTPPFDPTGQPCPACGEGRLIRGRAAWGCGRWREGCRFTVPFAVDGTPLTDDQLRARIQG